MRYAAISGKPVPRRLEAELRAMGCGADITITSCLRTESAVWWARRNGLSLSSQVELWNGWLRRLPGYNPANPPGHSTHELRNDGIAYAGWSGMPLRYWQVGIDNDNSPLLCARARDRGWIATVTYPNSASERHHVNFRKEPRIKVFKVLKHGSRGRRVAAMTSALEYLGYLRGFGADGTGLFDHHVERALERFQRDWHQTADGIYGAHTAKQLKACVRGRKRARKAAHKIKDPHERKQELERIGRRYGPN